MTPSHRTDVSSAKAVATAGNDRCIRGSQRRGPPLGATRQTTWGQPNYLAKSTQGREIGATQSQASSSTALD